ncbi:MAG: helix-turn-helix domain-containing protein [Clostridia bacterium]|nr:helix-turn-helix domain-containing protein [Clostridia bacterium]
MTIGEKIAHLRSHAKMTQEELSEYLGISRQSVSKWEVDQAEPRIDKILQMCVLFQITADDLIREDVQLSRTDDQPELKYRSNFFGAHGFRAEAGTRLTAELAFKVGRFLGWYYASDLSGCRDRTYRPRVVIGKDTRQSSYTLEYAIAAGLTASGATAYMLHVTTIPSVSFVTRSENFDCGIMISASQSSFYINAINMVNRHGERMDDRTLAYLEAYLDGRTEELGLNALDLPQATHDRIGTIVDYVAGRNRYIGYLISLAANSYRELRIGLDCANGAAWMIAPSVFEALGARTFVIHARPDGQNICRDSGIAHPEELQKLVVENRLDIGIAFDGDADRCIAVDEKGNVLTGEHILYILANRLHRLGGLQDNTVVTTDVCSIGLDRSLAEAGILSDRAPTGTRHFYQRMVDKGYTLGGEQSGSIVMRKYATAGDGLLTALMLIEEMLDRKQVLSALTADLKLFRQTFVELRVSDKKQVMLDAEIRRRVEEICHSEGGNTRALLQESPAYPYIRILAEAENEAEAGRIAGELSELIRSKGYAHA